MPDIRSFSNPLIKRIRSLKYKKYRTREGLFWSDGIRFVLEALDAGWEIETVVWCPELLRSDQALKQLAAATVPQITVTEAVYHHLTTSELPQGLGALIRLPKHRLVDFTVDAGDFILVLEEPQDRGNVGAIVRTADCVGSAAVILLGKAVDPYDPDSLRSSMGAIFSTPILTCPTVIEFLAWARDQGLWLVGTSARAKTDFRRASWQRPLALILGNERKGLSPQIQEHLHETVSIPIVGRSSSLNLAAAAAVLAYHLQFGK